MGRGGGGGGGGGPKAKKFRQAKIKGGKIRQQLLATQEKRLINYKSKILVPLIHREKKFKQLRKVLPLPSLF